MASRRETGDDVVAALTEMLDRRIPVDDRERQSIEQFRDELSQLDRPCDEHADRTHVTASAIIVSRRGVILHRHKILGLWVQPGGHINADEAPADAAIRETLEETGLKARHFCGDAHPLVIHVDVHPGPRGHTHLDIRYLLVAPDDDPTPPKGESPDVAWFSWAKAATASSEVGLSGILGALVDVTVRDAVTDDAPAVAELYLRSFRHAYDATAVRLAHDDDDVRRWIRDDLLPTHTVTLAVAAGTVPIGFVAEQPGRVSHLYVDPAWIRRGIGSQLLRVAMDRQSGGLSLWTFEANKRARAFYEHRGFKAVERTDGAGNEERQPDVRYSWEP